MEEQVKQEMETKSNIQMWIIIVLLIIIAVMGFFLGKNSSGTTETTNTPSNTNNQTTGEVTGDYEELSITVIGDKRCTNCPTDEILNQLQQLPSVKDATITQKDFSDEGVEQYLQDNDVTALPLFVFSTNNFDVSADPAQTGPDGQSAPKVNTFLEPLPGGEYTLQVGASFNPFAERSEKGFLLLPKEELQAIKDNSYIKGNKDAKITWIEYSDLECPFCAKLHNQGTDTDIMEKYGNDINMVFNHFPLGFHANALPGAQVLECLAEQKGSDAFYALIKQAFTDEKSTKSYLMEEAGKLGANEDSLEECVDSKKYVDKVNGQMEKGTSLFGVTGTPGNVLINNETGEYEVISWAYPTSAFETTIDELLK